MPYSSSVSCEGAYNDYVPQGSHAQNPGQAEHFCSEERERNKHSGQWMFSLYECFNPPSHPSLLLS